MTFFLRVECQGGIQPFEIFSPQFSNLQANFEMFKSASQLSRLIESHNFSLVHAKLMEA